MHEHCHSYLKFQAIPSRNFVYRQLRDFIILSLMERFALGQVTEGVLFLEDMEGELMLIYHNEAASNILGSPICEANWLSAFSCPSKFIHLSKECLTKKQKISDYLEICKEEQIIYFSFSPFEESKIVISFQSLQFMSLQPLLSAFQELHTSVVEYHPEQKVSNFVFQS